MKFQVYHSRHGVCCVASMSALVAVVLLSVCYETGAYEIYHDEEVDANDDADLDYQYDTETEDFVTTAVLTTLGEETDNYNNRIRRFGDRSSGVRTLGPDEIEDVKGILKEILAGHQVDSLDWTTGLETMTNVDDDTNTFEMSTEDIFTGFTKITDPEDLTKFCEDLVEEILDNAKKQGQLTTTDIRRTETNTVFGTQTEKVSFNAEKSHGLTNENNGSFTRNQYLRKRHGPRPNKTEFPNRNINGFPSWVRNFPDIIPDAPERTQKPVNVKFTLELTEEEESVFASRTPIEEVFQDSTVNVDNKYEANEDLPTNINDANRNEKEKGEETEDKVNMVDDKIRLRGGDTTTTETTSAMTTDTKKSSTVPTNEPTTTKQDEDDDDEDDDEDSTTKTTTTISTMSDNTKKSSTEPAEEEAGDEDSTTKITTTTVTKKSSTEPTNESTTTKQDEDSTTKTTTVISTMSDNTKKSSTATTSKTTPKKTQKTTKGLTARPTTPRRTRPSTLPVADPHYYPYPYSTRLYPQKTTTNRTKPWRTRLRKSTTEGPSTTERPQFDVDALVWLIKNLTDHYESNITSEFNKTIQLYNIPTCPSLEVTEQPIYYDLFNATVVAKCFVCGLHAEGIPEDTYCNDAFATDFIPLVPIDPLAVGHLVQFRKYCRYLDVHNYYENATEPRSVYGRFTGGCSVRWIDLTGHYTQRACRNRRRAMTGKHFASKRMAKLEMALNDLDNGCIVSPMASLVPLSRGISLFARFHACVCTGSWCNRTTVNRPWVMYIAMFVCWTIVTSVK